MTLRFDIALQRGAFSLAAQAEFPPGRTVALVGPSGSGKTSLLRALAGLEAGVRGSIAFEQETWLGPSRPRPLPPHRRRIGYVFQHAALFPHLDVAGNLRYAARRAPDPKADLAPLVDATGIAPLLRRQPDSLSGGERQRVALARALAAQPRLLMLDEPLSALDEAARLDIVQTLQSLFRDLALPVLYVTHQRAEAAYLADLVLRLENGRVAGFGPARELLAPETDQRAGPRQPPFSILAAKQRHDFPDEGLARIDTDAGPLLVPLAALGAGLPPRLLVPAREVGISLQPLERTSFLNHLPATIAELAPYAHGQTLLTLRSGQARLYALVTARSVESLQLRPDLPVVALIKSVSLAPQLD